MTTTGTLPPVRVRPKLQTQARPSGLRPGARDLTGCELPPEEGLGAFADEVVPSEPVDWNTVLAGAVNPEDLVGPPHVPQPITPPPQSTQPSPFGQYTLCPQHEPPSVPCPQH